MSDDIDNALKSVLTDLAARAEAERAKEKPYQDLFEASEQGLQGLLSEASRQMTRTALNLGDVIKKKFNIPHVSEKLWKLLKALPLAMWEVRQEISDKEGGCCCADKARRIYYQEVLAEIKRIQANE